MLIASSLSIVCFCTYSTLQLQNAFNNAVNSGALTKALYILSGSSKMTFFMGTPTAGLAAPLLKPTQGIKGSAEGIVANGANDDANLSSNDDGSGTAEYISAPTNDDGNAPTDDGGAASNPSSSTDDGSAGGDFRRLEEGEEGFFEEEKNELFVARYESTEFDMIGERPGMETEAQRNLRGVLVSVSPIPTTLSTSL